MLVLARGGDPLEPPLAQGPVPSSRGLGRAARGGDPPEPPAGSRPRSFVTRPWPCCPGATPLEPRCLKAVLPLGQPPKPLRGPGGQVLSRIRRELRCGVDGAKP